MKQDNSNTIQAFWVMMGSLSMFSLSIVSAAILSRYFDKAEYGTYRQILYVYTTLLVIFTAGLPSVFSYFLPRFSVAQGKDIVWKISKVLFLAGLVFSIFLFSFSGPIAVVLKNPELSIGLKYFSPIPMLLLPTLGIEGIFSAYKKTIFIAAYNTLSRILMLLFIVMPVVYFKGGSYLYAIYGWLVVSFITLIMAYYFKGIPFKGIKAEKANLSYREVFSFSLSLVVSILSGIAIKAADQFYISRFFGVEVFAVFSNGFIELPLVAMVKGATSTVLMPIFSKLVHDKSDIVDITNLWRNALIKSATLIYPIATFFIFNAKDIIIILYSDKYADSVIYFKIALLLNFFNFSIAATLLLAMGEVKYYSKLSMLFAFLAWIVSYLVLILFNSPMAIAVFSVSLAMIKELVFMKYVASLLDIRFFDIIPVKKASALIVHSCIVAESVKIFISQLFPQATIFVSLTTNLLGFIIIILLTANIFNLDYLWVIQPLMDKFNNKRIKV